MAKILLERNFSLGSLGLFESLEKLETRWRKQRRNELGAMIREAELRKDSARLEHLLEEKRRLDRVSHPSFRPGREGV